MEMFAAYPSASSHEYQNINFISIQQGTVKHKVVDLSITHPERFFANCFGWSDMTSKCNKNVFIKTWTYLNYQCGFFVDICGLSMQVLLNEQLRNILGHYENTHINHQIFLKFFCSKKVAVAPVRWKIPLKLYNKSLYFCRELRNKTSLRLVENSFDFFMSSIPHSCWRHRMETFSALLAICAGNSPVTGVFSAQRPVTRNFEAFFDLRPNKRLRKQW